VLEVVMIGSRWSDPRVLRKVVPFMAMDIEE